MAIQRRRSHLGGLAFWLAVASSALIGLTFLVSTVGSLLGAPPQQAWFTIMIGVGLAAGLVCAFAGVVTAHATRRQDGAQRRAKSALIAGYTILGSLAVLSVLAMVALIATLPK